MKPAPVPKIALDHILLEPLSSDDVDALFEVARNPASIEDYQYAAESADDVAFWVEAALEGREYAWTIRPRSDPDAVVGMVSLEPESDAVAEAGYFVDQAFQGRGYATEALAAAVAWVCAHTSIHRVKVGVTDGNTASQRVAEKAGFSYEGRSRKDWRWRDRWYDSLNYAILAEDLAHPPDGRAYPCRAKVVEITRDNLESVLRLDVAQSQKRFVTPNAISLAQACVEPGAWYRGIAWGDGALAGFIMVHDPSLPGAAADADDPGDGPYIWRLMVDAASQRLGCGTVAVGAAQEYARKRGFGCIYVSGVDAPGGPVPFYEKRGFVRTGRVVDGEVELRKDLSS